MLAQRGNMNGHLGGGRLPQAQRPRGRGVAELSRLAPEQGAHLGDGITQPGGRVLERDVVEPLRQRAGARAQAEDKAARADLVEGGGGHREGGRGARSDQLDRLRTL